MSRTTGPQPDSAWYEIRVQGRLDARWAAWLDGMTVRADGRTTLIVGRVVDQPALHGLLARLRDLNVPLIAVNQVDPGGGPRRIVPTTPSEET